MLPHITGLAFHVMFKVSYPMEEIASLLDVVPCRRVDNFAHPSCSEQCGEIFFSTRYHSSPYRLVLFWPGALQLTLTFTSMVALTHLYVFRQPSVRKFLDIQPLPVWKVSSPSYTGVTEKYQPPSAESSSAVPVSNDISGGAFSDIRDAASQVMKTARSMGGSEAKTPGGRTME